MARSLTAADVLERAHALIIDERKYHVRGRAVSKAGSLVDPRGKGAVKWSVRGAIERYARDNGIAEAKALRAFESIAGASIEEYCAAHTHDNALDILRLAAAGIRLIEGNK